MRAEVQSSTVVCAVAHVLRHACARLACDVYAVVCVVLPAARRVGCSCVKLLMLTGCCAVQSMLTAKDLPHCTLSRHLEKRLEQMLDQERGQRALSMAQSPSQVQVSTTPARA